MAIDVGAGDGRAILAIAAADPATLAIGLDATAASMAEASRRAARAAAKGGRPNALFVVAAADAMPRELAGLADLVTARFPWGSLLRGCLGGEPAVAAGLAGLLAPGATLELLIAPAERDRLAGIPTEPADVIGAVRSTFEPLGLGLIDGREATVSEVRASHSTWARRLLAHGGGRAERRVTLVRLRSSRR